MADLFSKFTSLYELAKSFNNVDLLKEISDLKMETSVLTDENRELKEKVRQLQFDKKNPLTFRNGLYYAAGDDIPWCPHCYEVSHIRTHLIRDQNFKVIGYYKCTHCDLVICLGDY
jgi:hypothetical protein